MSPTFKLFKSFADFFSSIKIFATFVCLSSQKLGYKITTTVYILEYLIINFNRCTQYFFVLKKTVVVQLIYLKKKMFAFKTTFKHLSFRSKVFKDHEKQIQLSASKL